MNLFGELLRDARKRARLSQQALADKVGVDDSYISKMENGVDKPPTREVAVKLAEALGLSDKGDPNRIKFLSAAEVVSDEDLKGFALVKIENGGVEEDEDKDAGGEEPDGGRSAVDWSSKRASAPSTVYRSPISLTQQKILMHRLAVLEKMLHNANEELREIEALAADMYNEE